MILVINTIIGMAVVSSAIDIPEAVNADISSGNLACLETIWWDNRHKIAIIIAAIIVSANATPLG